MSLIPPIPSPDSTPPSSPAPLLSPGDGEVWGSTYGNRWWRIQNLYKIQDKNKNLVNIRFNTIQLCIIRDIIEALMAGRPIRHFDLKYRQGGVSTFWLLFYLDDTIFNPNTKTGILADKKENLGYLFEIVRLAHATMPPGIQPRLKADSKSELAFEDLNSKIFVSLSIKSTSLHNLHISEVCYCDDIEIRRTLGACPPSANITMESTGNGLGNYGYEKYQDSKMRLNEYMARFSPWFIQPEYRIPLNGQDPLRIMASLSPKEQWLQGLMLKDYGLALQPEQVLWRRQTERDQKDLFPQEFPETEQDAFLASGLMFFDAKKVQKLYEEARAYLDANPPYKTDERFGHWTQFEPVDKYSTYAAGADTSEGAKDPSVLKIINVTKNREAFVYRSRVSVKAFYQACNLWGRYFNNALMGVERNNHGHAVLLGLEEICKYPNLYFENMFDTTRRLSTEEIEKKKYGWPTNQTTRPIMLDQLKMAIEGDPQDDEETFQPAYTVFDKIFLGECLTFQEIEGKYQAVPGKFDDDVMASAIANQMRQFVAKHRVASKSPGIQVGAKRDYAS